MVAAGESLMGRWWHRFQVQRTFVAEADWRFRHHLLLPADFVDVPLEPAIRAELARIYPHTPSWMKERYFPAGFPAPTFPSVFYFHREMAMETDPRRAERFDEVVMHEWAVLYVASWWHEAA